MDDTTNRTEPQSGQHSESTKLKPEQLSRGHRPKRGKRELLARTEPKGSQKVPETTNDEAPETMSREKRRSRRKRVVRARTISVKRLTKRDLEMGRLLYPETDYWRPRTRGECLHATSGNRERPCPYVSCKYHLYIDVSPRTGGIKLNFPDIEVWEMKETCALDVADRGATTLEQVGEIMNLTRERIRQLELRALAKLNALSDMQILREYVDEGPNGKRRLPMLTADDFEEPSSNQAPTEDDSDSEDAFDHAVPLPDDVLDSFEI